MGSARIWWHEGAVENIGGSPTIVLEEPEISTETVSTDASTAAASAAAPAGARFAVVKVDEAMYYKVSQSGETVVAADSTCKVIAENATDHDYLTIDCRAGGKVSLLDVA